MPHAFGAQEGGKVKLNFAQHAHLDALTTQHLYQIGKIKTVYVMRHHNRGLGTQKQPKVVVIKHDPSLNKLQGMCT